jgi:hypothetical protein
MGIYLLRPYDVTTQEESIDNINKDQSHVCYIYFEQEPLF